MKPGVCTVVWASGGAVAAVARDRAQLVRLAPPIVMLHVSLLLSKADAAAALDALHALLPGVRLWLALGGNPFAAMARDAMIGAADEWAEFAYGASCELLMLNLEQDDPGRGQPPRAYHGWNLKHWPGREGELREKAAALVAACAAVLPAALTSHDCPQYFELPWHELLGPESPLVLHAPQHYPGRTGGATLREMRQRIDDASATGWGYRTRGGQVAARYAPRGECWAPYTQLYAVQTAALTWAADQAPVVVLGWTLGDSDAAGRLALEVTCRARREAGEGAGAMARWQEAHELVGDGAAGDKTLTAMGLA